MWHNGFFFGWSTAMLGSMAVEMKYVLGGLITHTFQLKKMWDDTSAV